MTGINNVLKCWSVHNRGPIFVASYAPVMPMLSSIFGTFILGESLFLGWYFPSTLICDNLSLDNTCGRQSCIQGSFHVFSSQWTGGWPAGLQIWEDLYMPLTPYKNLFALMFQSFMDHVHCCWGLLGSVIGTTLILSGLFLVTWGQSVERRLKALSVGPTIPISRALETPLLRYSEPSVLSVLSPLNCMEMNSKRSWCKMGRFLTLGFWGCLISSANWGGIRLI